MPSLGSQVRDKWNGFSLGGKLLIILGIIAGLVVLFMLFPVQCMCAVGGIILLFMLYAYLSSGASRRRAADEHDIHIIVDSREESRPRTRRRPVGRSPIDPRPPESLRHYQERTLRDVRKSQEDAFRKTKKRFWG